ncbi:MAG: tetrahydrofolate dehydrogenase/cyclohydrolase catalytic domain-containing protein, partial [Eubacteriales bacterium]|nr:tetrahydrofolate dehydrogenase/cyclohydrolase catalytic domain-containing protein [Eubacteriales bacterium]
MTNLIDGKGIAAELRAKCAERVSNLISNGIVPKLAVIIVGDDPASHQYV